MVIINGIALIIGYVVLAAIAGFILSIGGWFIYGAYIEPAFDKLRTKVTGKPSKYPPRSEGYFTL